MPANGFTAAPAWIAGVARSYKCLQVFLKALDLFLMNILRQLHHFAARIHIRPSTLLLIK